MPGSVKKIAFLGPESTGKTTLCAQLAAHYHTAWVPEFARQYVETLNRKYTLEVIVYCAKKQLEEEENYLKKSNAFLFCDTELITAKVWCMDVFKTVPEWIGQMVVSHRYDLLLLTRPDIPFANDPVRENPHRREFFFDWYAKELKQYGFPYQIIEGVGELRLQNAIQALEQCRM